MDICARLVQLVAKDAAVLAPARSVAGLSNKATTTRFVDDACRRTDGDGGAHREQGEGQPSEDQGCEPPCSTAALYLCADGVDGVDEVDIGTFEECALRIIRERVCGGILRAASDRAREPPPRSEGNAPACASPKVEVASRSKSARVLPQRSYADEFPSLAVAASKKNVLEARISSSPLGVGNRSGGGQGQMPGQGSIQGRRRIVPTRSTSVQVDEKFVKAVTASGQVQSDGISGARNKDQRRICPQRVETETSQSTQACSSLAQPATPTVSRVQNGIERLALQTTGYVPRMGSVDNAGQGPESGGLGASFSLSRGVSSSFDSPLTFALDDDDEEEECGMGTNEEEDENNRVPFGSLAKLHGRILEYSPRIFLISEISLVLDVLVVDPRCRIEDDRVGENMAGVDGVDEGEKMDACCDRILSGSEAISYASTVLVSAGESLIASLGVKVLRELGSFLSMRAKTMTNAPRSLFALKRMVSCALREAEPSTFLHSSSPSTGNIQSSGRMLGLTGLNVFLNDGGGSSSRSAEDQRRLSNRETFRDSWFKLMRDAVNRSTSLDAKPVVTAGHTGASGSSFVADVVRTPTTSSRAANTGELTVLKAIQEESSQLLRGLRVDNYEPFAELFTAAVLQAAVTGETIMDEELTGIAKQNVSRFQSLNKRFQMNSSSGGTGSVTAGRSQPRSLSKLSRKGQVDQTVEHALRVAGEFPKSLRPFVLFLEATDSHRLDLALSNTMRAKLGSLMRSSAKSAVGSELEEGVLSVDELCISTTALAGFLGYFSFTKGRNSVDELSPVITRLGEQGEFDGSHHIDARSVLLHSISSHVGGCPGGLDVVNGSDGPRGWLTNNQAGALFRSLPWICRYLKFLSWDSRQATGNYFKGMFGMLEHIRRHPYLQPSGRMYRGVASLCLRGMLDDLMWLFPSLSTISTSATKLLDENLDTSLGEDILWGNENLGRRYLEVAVPDISYLENVVSSKTVLSSQAIKVVKKIRPTAPISTAQRNRLQKAAPEMENGAREHPGAPPASRMDNHKSYIAADMERPMTRAETITNEIGKPTAKNDHGDRHALGGDNDSDSSVFSSGSQEDTLKELERVFLEQYSSSSRVTDVKLRDFVTWCSDAVARQGVAAGLATASTPGRHHAMDTILKDIRREASRCKQEVKKASLREACAALEDHFASKYYHAIKSLSVEALQQKIIQSSKDASDILLPQAWGEHVRMTAAAIVARRAESAGTRQLLAELKRLSLSKTKEAIEASIKSKEGNVNHSATDDI